ncbi:hypothetical protein EJB05_17905, partial [Eragrostis curvula]
MASSAAATAVGWLLSPLLQSLSNRVRSYADDLLRYLPEGSASADLDRLSGHLLRLHAASSSIERARRHPCDPTLLAWLNRLHDAAHDADDLLDEIHYGRLADAVTGPRPDLGRVLDTSRTICSRLVCPDQPLNRLPAVLDKLATALADYAWIAPLVERDAAESLQRGNMLARHSSSIVAADDAFFGRERELALLVERLVGGNGSAPIGNRGVPIVAIVGDGGIGKTKLAQMVFNHAVIQGHFDLLMWVCVSSHMDDVKLTREILQAATDWKVDYDGVDFNGLQKLLISAVEGRRFLLILDDVWDDKEGSMWENTERWKKLLLPLQNGKQESRIVVTTRMKMVADMLGVRSPMMLGGLGAEDHCLLLKKCALGSENSRQYPHLQEIGKKIALKLKGSPLGARVIGGILCSTRSAREWNNILETYIHGDIVSTLLSSYYHLPLHLQNCFAYCSIFPKNWKFDRKKLVRMWMAQGFIQMENGSMEDLGREYFRQLLARSFFHTLKQGNRTYYVMHDLIHDLAQMVSQCDCARIEGDMSKSIPSTVRHLSISSNSLPQLKKQCDFKRLHTLVVYKDSMMSSSAILNDLFSEIKNVRTLDLSGCLISELPESIGQLIHLRYMALPGSIKMLPEFVSMLLHLQTLDIPKKCQLDKFPEGMHQLVSLRHLGVDSRYISMIRGIGGLVKLQGSMEYHVKKEEGRTLEELKDMNDLHGLLHIKNLENVQYKEEACNAQLSNKRYLKILKLEWNSVGFAFGPNMDAEVLECLEPNKNLEELHIRRYKGASSPSWLEMKVLFQLKSVYLTNCRRWELLPPLGQLPFLSVLHLKEMCSVNEIGLKFYGGATVTFPSLKDFELDDLPNLDCQMLSSLTILENFIFLKSLTIETCIRVTAESLPAELKRMISLNKLSISHCPGFLSLPNNIPLSLEFLHLIGCHPVLTKGLLEKQVGLGATVPTSMLREDFVRDYRENARNKIESSLVECLQICKIQAEILIIDRPDVPPALLELIKEHKITTLVMCTKNRHQRTNVCTSTKNKISSLGSCHFSGSSNTTTTRSSSFFNSHSTADNFGAEQLDNPSLGMNPMYIFDDNRFNAIIGLESLGTFREFISQRISTEYSRDLYQVFQTQYCDIFTRCESIGGFDSVLGVDYQNLGKDHWKYMRSWPAVLEYIVNILNTMHMQLKQNHPACDGFTHEDLLEAAKKPLNRLFTVASVICSHEVRKSPEKLFCVLNMYTSLTDATPTLRKVFGTEFISRYAEGLLAKLKDSARGIVEELKGLILAYSSQIVVPNEGTMSLTGYIMRAQVSWKIPCPVLRNELREKILQFIIPAYHAYMDSRRLSIRETPEDFELELKTKIANKKRNIGSSEDEQGADTSF